MNILVTGANGQLGHETQKCTKNSKHKFDFAKLICELSGNKCDILPCYSEEFPSPVKRPHFSVLDKTKLKQVFDWKVPYWTDSLKKCIAELENAK